MKRSVYLTSSRSQEVADRLTYRDWQIVQSLSKLRVAQARQLQRLHFVDETPSTQARRCRRRLERLTALQVVDRLDRTVGGVRAGSSGHIYVLSTAGIKLAARLGGTMASRPQRPSTPGVAFLGHRLAITELYVRLVEAERRGLLDLMRFDAEPDSWRRHVGRGWVKPDAFLEIAVGADEFDGYFVEIDRGTQSAKVLAEKCDVYWDYSGTYADGEAFPEVLFLVPDEKRKAFVVDVLAKLPARRWKLFGVRLFDEAVERFIQGSEE